MKKILFFAAAVALFTHTSCQKIEDPIQEQRENLVFTATIAGQDSKTTVDAASGKISWSLDDEITITDNNSESVKYIISSIDATTGNATFIKKPSENKNLGAGPYTAVYGSAPAAEQTYSTEAPALPMSASSETTKLKFTVTCGLLKLNLTSREKVTGIVITGTPTGGSETTFTLTCPEPVNIASKTCFFIALPAGSYNSFLINGENGAQCKKEKSGSNVAITANHITPISFSKDLHFAVQLWADGPYWATTNIGATTPEEYGQYFAWGYTEGCVRNSANNGWVLASDETITKQFNTSIFRNRTASTYQDAATANWGNDWTVPTKSDFDDLISTKNTSIEKITSGIKGIKIKGIGDYSSNFIFFPAAGYGTNANLSSSYSYYWSCETNGGNIVRPIRLQTSSQQSFLGDKPSVVNANYGYEGCPIRPVRYSL